MYPNPLFNEAMNVNIQENPFLPSDEAGMIDQSSKLYVTLEPQTFVRRFWPQTHFFGINSLLEIQLSLFHRIVSQRSRWENDHSLCRSTFKLWLPSLPEPKYNVIVMLPPGTQAVRNGE